MENKKGISLVILTITIIVMIILASVVIYIAADTTNNSKMAAFASDLEQVEDLVNEYYLANGTLPVVSSATGYNKTQFTGLITNGKSTLVSEIISNGDDSAVFYKLDLSKLDIESTKRGLEADGDTTDAYFVASNTFNVYYLKGRKIANDYYFSLTKNLTGKTKVANSQNIDNSNITISNVTGGIKLTKSTADYTNSLSVEVTTTLSAGETMSYKLAGQDITVESGVTTIEVASILSSNNDIKTAFYTNDSNKVLVAQKYSSGNLVAEAKISLTNLDMLSGNMISAGDISYSKYDDFILANISGYADLGGSGVKEARVVYVTKALADGTTEAYYSNLPATITKEYVRNAGKSFSKDTLRLPADVKSFALVFIDNAGNVSDVGTYTVN